MSHQINLYDPSLLRQRQTFNAANLLLAVIVLAAGLFGWGAWARIDAERQGREITELEARARSAREESVALASRLAGRKPDAQLDQNIAAAREMLLVRQSMLDKLGEGSASAVGGHAERLRGLARQGIEGLWLTGFVVGTDGRTITIRGRTLDPALLPEYIRRLNAEPAFRGHRFATLNVALPAPTTPTATTVAVAVAPPAFHEFTLGPEPDGIREGAKP